MQLNNVITLIVITLIEIITRISRFSAYALAIFTVYTAWAALGGHKLEMTYGHFYMSISIIAYLFIYLLSAN